MTSTLPPRHLLLALAVVAVWGSNFVVIKSALAQFPPLLLAALRFSFATLPAACFLPRPRVAWSNVAAYGLLIGVGQFGLLYVAMDGRISPGLASLVIQVQVFLTVGLAMPFARERVRPYQGVALLLAGAGIGVIAAHTDGSTTIAGLVLVLAAALGWAGGNIVGKRAGAVNAVAYVVWSSAFAVLPLLALSFAFEGWSAIRSGLEHADAGAWSAVLWQAWGNSLFGYAVWGWLLARHPAATVTPMAMLVPVFGMGASAWWLSEPLPPWKIAAAALVLSGLGLNLAWPRWIGRYGAR